MNLFPWFSVGIHKLDKFLTLPLIFGNIFRYLIADGAAILMHCDVSIRFLGILGTNAFRIPVAANGRTFIIFNQVSGGSIEIDNWLQKFRQSNGPLQAVMFC